jgi:hypothetical protein
MTGRKTTVRINGYISGAVLPAQSAFSQTLPEDVLVTGSRIAGSFQSGASVTVVTREELDRQQPSTGSRSTIRRTLEAAHMTSPRSIPQTSKESRSREVQRDRSAFPDDSGGPRYVQTCSANRAT